jgi:hypothetical protein
VVLDNGIRLCQPAVAHRGAAYALHALRCALGRPSGGSPHVDELLQLGEPLRSVGPT